jgi:hypothetical protein
MRSSLPAAFLAVLVAAPLGAQAPRTQINGFGHLEFATRRSDSTDVYFTIGEHSLFLTSELAPRLTFLGEFVVRYNASSATNYLPSIERALARYAYRDKHALIVGKVHTPLNYWNDSYHHGRLFFPTIDRPMAFSHYVPLHTLGVQLQGQNIGKWNFGYDLMAGNGISATDAFHANMKQALMASVYIKPLPGTRFNASIYHDYMERNGYGVHSGHTASPFRPAKPYTGPVDFMLGSLSAAWFRGKVEALTELSMNRSATDTLGVAMNPSYYVYAGYKVRENLTPYAFVDHIRSEPNDLHVYEVHKANRGIGLRYDISPLANLKIQLENGHEHVPHLGHDHEVGWTSFRLQFAYGF